MTFNAIRQYVRPSRQVFGATLLFTAMSFVLSVSPSGDELAVSDKPSAAESKSDKPKESVATLAGGCFWCTEAVFERMNGVNDVVSGYIGGHVKNPTYEEICAKDTGHVEAVEIYYDPKVISYTELLEIFFKTHDPTTLNRQGADEGPQYRSSIFFHNEQEKIAAANYIKKLNASGKFDGPIVTRLEPATKFYPAEEYHQDYFRLNPNARYCRYVVRSKVAKAESEFGDKMKENQK